MPDPKKVEKSGTRKLIEEKFGDKILLLRESHLEKLGFGPAATRRNQRWKGEVQIPSIKIGGKKYKYQFDK